MINPEIADAHATAFSILEQSRQKKGFASELIDQQLQSQRSQARIAVW